MGCDDPESDCHGLASDDVIVIIEGPDQLDFGEEGQFTITLDENVAGAIAAACLIDPCGAGLNVALAAPWGFGAADIVDPNTRLSIPVLNENPGEITHPFNANQHGPGIDAIAGSVGLYSYDFSLTASEQEGAITILGAMNAFNRDDDFTGDLWNRTTLEVSVPEPATGLYAAIAGGLLAVQFARRRAHLRADSAVRSRATPASPG